MSNSLAPLNFSATALTVLQARGNAQQSTLDSEPQIATPLQPEGEALAQQSAKTSGVAIPRGQFINVLV